MSIWSSFAASAWRRAPPIATPAQRSWPAIFWNLRRRGGPVTFVERQIAHSWAAGVIASIGIFIVEVQLGLPVLTLTPVLAVAAGMVFLVMAGTLSGWFYIAAALTFLSA